MAKVTLSFYLSAGILLAACGRLDHFGKPPSFTENSESEERRAMYDPGLPLVAEPNRNVDRASLWSGGQQSLLGDRRAMKRGDILTVVIEIDEEAEISNSTARSRTGSEELGIGQLFGVPQRLNEILPDGASLGDAVDITSTTVANWRHISLSNSEVGLLIDK